MMQMMHTVNHTILPGVKAEKDHPGPGLQNPHLRSASNRISSEPGTAPVLLSRLCAGGITPRSCRWYCMRMLVGLQ